jgi:hypothetical protein
MLWVLIHRERLIIGGDPTVLPGGRVGNKVTSSARGGGGPTASISAFSRAQWVGVKFCSEKSVKEKRRQRKGEHAGAKVGPNLTGVNMNGWP